MVSVQTSATFQPHVMGSVAGQLRALTPSEAEALQFVSHDKILTWEGIVADIGKPYVAVHLINTQKFAGHYGYTQNALGRGPEYTQFNFYSEVQFPQTRRYMPFLVFDFRDRPLLWNGSSHRWVMNIRRYDYKDSHQGLAHMLVGLKDLLARHLMAGYGEPLLFVYEKPGTHRRPHVEHLAEIKTVGFDTITEQQMIEAAGGSLVAVLNPGSAIGYVELIKVGEDGEHLTPRHIAVFEDTPERIPPVTGIVTLEPQTPLSHVNLLAKNRGTPNASTAKIELIPSLAKAIGKLVKMVAKPDGTVTFTTVSQAEAEQFWASKIKDKLEVPVITATSLDPVEFATGTSDDLTLPNIGSKASNYAVLQNLLDTQFVKPGFGLSFAHYQQVAAEADTQVIIRDLLARKNALAPGEINALLKLIRKSIEKHTTDAKIAPAIAAVRAVIAKMPGVKRIRLRSSTNSEDLPTFNGAGLYESKGFNIDDSDQKLRKKLLKVMASLWLERAFWEREIFAIDHADVGMAILINPAFSDEFANGVVVGSEESTGFRTWVNAQKGEASVTNPLDDELPESFAFVDEQILELRVQSRSNIGSVFLVDGADIVRPERRDSLLQLRHVTQQLYEHFAEEQQRQGDQRQYGIDIEYKLMQEGDSVRLYVKQSRLLNLGEAPPEKPAVPRIVAKDNGMGGAHLRRYPKQLSELQVNEVCVMKVNQVVGVNRVEDVGNGFTRINVVVPSTACPSFKGEVYVFRKHFNFL